MVIKKCSYFSLFHSKPLTSSTNSGVAKNGRRFTKIQPAFHTCLRVTTSLSITTILSIASIYFCTNIMMNADDRCKNNDIDSLDSLKFACAYIGASASVAGLGIGGFFAARFAYKNTFNDCKEKVLTNF